MILLNKKYFKSYFIIACCLLAASNVHAQKITEEGELPNISGYKKVQAESIFYDAMDAKRKGDLGKAEAILTQVIQLDPKAAGAYYELSHMASVQNDMDNAEGYIKKAIELEPDNKWYKEHYARVLINTDKNKEAAKIYEDLAKGEIRNRNYLEEAALIYARGGMLKEALKLYDKILVQYEDDEDVLNRQYQLYLQLKDMPNATKVIKRLMELNPDNVRYYVALAGLYEKEGQTEKAAALFEQAKDKFVDDPDLQMSLSEYYKEKGDKEKYRYYLSKVAVNKSLGAGSQLQILEAYIKSLDDNDEQGKQKAIELTKEIASQHPDNAQVYAMGGYVFTLNDMDGEAAEYYKKSLAEDPSNFGVWQNLLSSYVTVDKADSLVKYSQQALKVYPNQAILHYLYGIGLSNNKEFKKAANALQRAIDLQPEDNKALLADMYSMLADAYYNDKDYEQSDENFEKALSLNKDNSSVLNNYSYYLSVRGVRLDDAERMSKRSLELSPDQPTFLDTYGWIMYKQGKYKEAIEYIKKAIDADPANADATLWEHLGDAYQKQGNTQKAIECWQKAKTLDPTFDIDKKMGG